MEGLCKTTYLACPKCGSSNYTSTVYRRSIYDGEQWVGDRDYTVFRCEDCNCIFDIDDYGKVRTFADLIKVASENIKKLANSMQKFNEKFAIFTHSMKKFDDHIDEDLRTHLGDVHKFLEDARKHIDFGEPIKPLSKHPGAVQLGMDLGVVTIDEWSKEELGLEEKENKND